MDYNKNIYMDNSLNKLFESGFDCKFGIDWLID